jgi:hypothetical protein
MSTSVDFILKAPNTKAVLLVEAKSISSPSAEWATRFARNLLKDAEPRTNLFLLLVLRNYLYLWRDLPRDGADLPDLATRTEDVLEPYLRNVQTSLQDINGISFELLVKSWLTDMSEGRVLASVEKWIRQAGLEQFEHGTLREEQRN